jgi:hypothetical protein
MRQLRADRCTCSERDEVTQGHETSEQLRSAADAVATARAIVSVAETAGKFNEWRAA